MFSSKTDAALLMVQAEEAQCEMKADGYLRLGGAGRGDGLCCVGSGVRRDWCVTERGC